MLKLKIALFILAASASTISSAATTCSLQYVGPDNKVYTQATLQSFVDNEVRPKLANTSKSFNVVINEVCGSSTQSTLTLGIDPENFYVVSIDGKTLTDSQSTYTTANVSLSQAALLSAYTAALDFSGLSLSNQQNAVKTLAYFFAESARFGDIETEVGATMASASCVAEWTNYSHLIHRWSVLSKYAIHLNLVSGGYFGGGSDQLIAPVTDVIVKAYNKDVALGKKGPNASYIDSADWDDPITIPAACSTSTTSK